MSSVARRLIEEALTLPERERRQITEALLDSMSESPEDEEAWLDEVEQRIEQARTGEAPSLDGDEVITRLSMAGANRGTGIHASRDVRERETC